MLQVVENVLEQLSKTYGHLLPDSADRARAALDAFITNAAGTSGGVYNEDNR